MSDYVITLNAGSSSVKFALFRIDADGAAPVASGQVDGLGASPAFEAGIAGGERRAEAIDASDHRTAIEAIVRWLDRSFPDAYIGGIGHRIVHGGVKYTAPVIIDEATLVELEALSPLAPLHQPHNLAGVRAAAIAFPGAPQIGCFDTAFHRGHAFVNDAYALPRAFYERGLRRFGFHGLSYEFIAHRLRAIDPVCAQGRVVVAHLGNGASICAMRDGRSVASTMGFSALEGLPMGTRCGQIDPGLLLYLLDHDRMSTADLANLLYRESGLLGLSGVSQDMRALEAAETAPARDAINYFAHRIRMETAAMAATLEGVDALVFTGGIGQHSAHVRACVLRGLGWLGVALDESANAAHAEVISADSSSVRVFVLGADEEAMIARHAIEATRLARAKAA